MTASGSDSRRLPVADPVTESTVTSTVKVVTHPMVVCRAVLVVMAKVRPPPESVSVGAQVVGVTNGSAAYSSSKLSLIFSPAPRSVSPVLSLAMVPMLIVCWAMILFLRESVPTFCERYAVLGENRNTVCTFDPDSRLNALSQAHRLSVGHIDHTG